MFSNNFLCVYKSNKSRFLVVYVLQSLFTRRLANFGMHLHTYVGHKQ